MGMVDYCPKTPSRQKLLAGETPRWIARSPRGDYIAQVILSCPPWVSRKELQALKAAAAAITLATGTLHVLDHDIPLNHPRVCGLTVPWNLVIVPWRVNATKGNKWCPEQAELF